MATPKEQDKFIWGDLQDFLELKVSEIPHNGNDTLQSVGVLYSEIFYYLNALYRVYLLKGMYRAGYYNMDSIINTMENTMEGSPLLCLSDLDGWGEDYDEFDLYGTPVYAKDRLDEFTNYSVYFKKPSQTDFEIMQPLEFLAIGFYPKSNFIYAESQNWNFIIAHENIHYNENLEIKDPNIKKWSDNEFQKLCKELSNIEQETYRDVICNMGRKYDERNSYEVKLTKVILLHPTYLHRRKENKTASQSILKSMRKEAETFGISRVVSIEEFLAPYNIDKHSLNENWEEHVKWIVGELEKEYKFLKFRKYPTLYNDSLRDIREAKAQSDREQLTESDKREIAMKIGRGTEGLLKALYLLENNGYPEMPTYDTFLTGLRDSIISNFGDDVFEDLENIRFYRNIVSHPNSTPIKRFDLLKLVNASDQFAQLFRLRYVDKKPDLD